MDGKEEIIALISRTFSANQRNWHIYDKEAYAAYHAFVHFDNLLRESFFLLFTDHSNLLHVSLDSNPRVVRWRPYMQDFDFAMVCQKGEDNVVADAMSRLCRDREEDEPTTLHALSINPSIDRQYEAQRHGNGL